MQPRLIPWLTVLTALAAGTAGLGYFLSAQGSGLAGAWVVGLGQAAVYAWLVRGLYLWRRVGWVAKVSRLVILTLAAAFLVVTARMLGYLNAATMFLGAWGMAVGFGLGLELLRLALSPGWPILGVARTVLDEAIRMKMALIFVVLLVLLVPVLPLTLGGETRLQYSLESFLTYALTLVTTLLSVMTILLAVRTVTGELEDKQAHLTLTKPVGRTTYLAGKWLGIMALNLLLLGVSGLGVYAFVEVIKKQPAMDLADAVAVQEQVLTARASAEPVPVDNSVLTIDFEKRLLELRERGVDPSLYGQRGDPTSRVTPAQRQRIQIDALREWLTVQPRNRQTFRFAGLERARDAGPTVQLRFKPKAATPAGDKQVYMRLEVNGRAYLDPRNGEPLPPVRNDTFHTAYILSEDIRSDGTLDVTVYNTGADAGQSSISFKPDEGLEVFYKVGGFATNLAKGLFVIWVRLGFLAVLGLGAATFLGFPVACLLCFLVFLAAVGSAFLGESLSNYASLPRDEVPWWDTIWLTVERFLGQIKDGEFFDAFKLVVRLVGEAFTFVVPPMADYSPTSRIAYGRAVENAMLTGVVLRIGLVSSGVLGALAVWSFGRREIAQVTV